MKLTAEWIAALIAAATLLMGVMGVLIRWSLNGMRANISDIKSDTGYIKQAIEANRAKITEHEGRIGCLEGRTQGTTTRKVK
jgi:hypothetical protein